MMASSVTSGGSLVPLFYVVSIASVVVGGMWAGYRWYNQRKQEWTEGGKQAQALAEKLDTNTRAADRNTNAIDRLSGELHEFRARTDERLTRLERRFRTEERS